MANYTSIDDIISGVDNATKLRNDSKQDDGTDTITGVDWFSYNGTICSNIYASGNSWIGFGANSEHLRVNRRDAAMWNLWREEGTYSTSFNTYKFLRIRWIGYTAYSSTSSSALLTFDVVLFDTGDIMLYIADIPTDNYNGTFSLGNLTYDKPTTDNRYVSFYLQEDGSYTVDYAPISYSIKKYLLRNNDTIYTVTNGTLTEVVGELNANLFITHGIDVVPDGSLLVPLSAPEVLCWTDADKTPYITATVQGTPIGTHDIISDDIPIGHYSVYGITGVEAVASEGAMFLLSFDNGAYMIYDVDSESWITSDVGMTTSELLAVPLTAWNTVVANYQAMRMKVILDGTDTVTNVKFNFDNVAPVAESEV